MSNSPRLTRRVGPRLVAACAAASLCVSAFALAQAAPAAAPPSTARPAGTAPAAPRPAAPARAAAPAAAAAEQQAAPTPEDIFAAWDKDKNRTLSLTEFKTGWEEVRQASMLSRIGGQFRAVDANRDGSLSPAEYSNLPLIKRAGSAAPALSAFDTDRNGKLDFREYIRMVEGLVKSATDASGG